VTDGLDVVAVGVEYERAVVVRVVLARAGRSVVARPGGQRRPVEGVARDAVVSRECDVSGVVGSPRWLMKKYGLRFSPKPVTPGSSMMGSMPSGLSAAS